jgi:hypothetical protein
VSGSAGYLGCCGEVDCWLVVLENGVDISSHFIEGVAASTNRKQLVSCIVFVSFD